MTHTLAMPKLHSSAERHGPEELARRLSKKSVVRHNEPLRKRTTLRVGGAADLYIEPASEEDLSAVLNFCRERKLPFFILGRGSNLLVKDGGFHGVVINLSQPHFSGISVVEPSLHCGAGARLKAIAVEAKRHGLAGLEFLEGIPGSVGGGLRMNAGAMGGAMFDVVDAVRVVDGSGRMRDCAPSEMSVTYRACGLLRDHAALGAVLRG